MAQKQPFWTLKQQKPYARLSGILHAVVSGMANKTPNGYVIYETAFIVVIATGFKRKSANIKTGAMIQVWFLNRHLHPVVAQQLGKDKVVCGNCPLRPANNGQCYVETGKAPSAVYRAYKRGSYPRLPSTDVFLGHAVRFGAYGDPSKLPLPLLADIASKASRWTGYTHQWRNPLLKGYAAYLMASVDGSDEQIEATSAGWRTFRVAPKGSNWKFRDEISCPASKEAGEKVTCVQCGLCAGQAKHGAKNIVIQQH